MLGRTGLVAIAAVAFVAGAACRRDAPGRPPAEPVVFRLEPQGSRPVLLGDGHGTKRSAIEADVPSTLAWPIQVPRGGARVRTALALDTARLGDAAAPCRARVESRRVGESVLLAQREIEPGRPWVHLTADLVSADTELRLSVSCSLPQGAARQAARWAVPVVYEPSDGPGVLLVTIDTLRADHLGCYGYGRPTSPSIDRLAARGLLFRHAESVQSATWPALTSLHTSLYPSAHGVVWNGWQPRAGLTTLAELLQASGYSTSAFLTNMQRAQHPGFESVHRSRGRVQSEQDRLVTDAAIEQLERVGDRRFFVWLHLLSPHADYSPPAAQAAAFARRGASPGDGSMERLVALRARGEGLSADEVARVVDLYDAEVAYADEQVGRLLDALRRRGLERRTLVVLTADHGEDLYQHNRYFFHSPSMYSSSLAVPLVLSWPGVVVPGETDHLASLVDIAPTVLGLLGLPEPSFFQGRALLEKGALPRRPARSLAFSETEGRIFGVRAPTWRLVFNPERLNPAAPGGPYPIGELELYDLGGDPHEQSNAATVRRDVAERLTADVQAWRREHVRGGPAGQTVDPATRDELRALGYIVP